MTSGALSSTLSRVGGSLRWHIRRMPERIVERGLDPAWLGWRWMPVESVPEHVARKTREEAAGPARIERVHESAIIRNPLPRNIDDRDALSNDGDLWGYAMRDVPERASAATFIATVPDCRLYFFTDPDKNNFYPSIVTGDGRALKLREIAFKPRHGEQIRAGVQPRRMERATWICERVYHNHSHWLTAHLPKLVLLKQRGLTEGILLPKERHGVIDASLRMLGFDPESFPVFDPAVPLVVGELTLVGSDRFRPELLRPVRDALSTVSDVPPSRRIFISRRKSRGRRLLNEDALWPSLERRGFERVCMEDLDFEEQVRLMQQTQVLAAPHGAGLTNMMFCREGAHVLEIADPGFPNPNFYALASAMGLNYWLAHADAVGDAEHPLDRDLHVDASVIEPILAEIT